VIGKSQAGAGGRPLLRLLADGKIPVLYVGAMDFWNLGNLTACCSCSRKADLPEKRAADSDYHQKGPNSPRGDKPQLGGVGIVFQGTEDGGLKVSSIMPNGPAAASGLVQEGDLLISVNRVSIDGMTDQQLARNLLGPFGSKVTLGLEKPDGRLLEAELVRAFTSKQRASAVGVVKKGP
jgi:C-terminal processing protease CtpA/Prc